MCSAGPPAGPHRSAWVPPPPATWADTWSPPARDCAGRARDPHCAPSPAGSASHLPGGRPSPLPRPQHLKPSGSWAQALGPILIAHLWGGKALIGGPLPRDPRGSPHVPSHRPGAASSKSGRDGRDLNPGTTRAAGAAVPATPAAGPGASRSGGGRGVTWGAAGRTWRREPRAPGSTASGPGAACAGSAAGRRGCPPPGSLARWLSWAPCPGRYLIKQRTGRQAGAQAEVPGRARQEEVCPTAGRGAVQSCH